MEKIEFHRNVDAYSSLAVQMGTLIEITVPERPNDIEGAWQIHASNSLDGEIILLDARYEHKDADRGDYGRTIFIVYCNQ